MAVFSHILVPSDDPDIKVAALATVTASAAQTIGYRQIVGINATQDITFILYDAGSGQTKTPTAANFRIPANTTFTFEMGHNDTLKVFNLAGSSADVYIKRFTRI